MMYESTANVGYYGTLTLMELDDPSAVIFQINDYYAIIAYNALLGKGIKTRKDVMKRVL